MNSEVKNQPHRRRRKMRTYECLFLLIAQPLKMAKYKDFNVFYYCSFGGVIGCAVNSSPTAGTIHQIPEASASGIFLMLKTSTRIEIHTIHESGYILDWRKLL